MQNLANDLRQAVNQAVPELLALPSDETSARPAPGKWSQREILGHLIDSASNNHQRFVRAQFKDDLVFAGYRQAEWVEVQNYQDGKWRDLVNFWAHYNLHLARAIEQIPEHILTMEREKHNLHQIGWQTVPEDQSATLGYFINDYIGHLQHHLNQIRQL